MIYTKVCKIQNGIKVIYLLYQLRHLTIQLCNFVTLKYPIKYIINIPILGASLIT